MRLHENLQDIERINELVEGGFNDEKAASEVLAIRRTDLASGVSRVARALDYYDSRIERLEKIKEEASAAIRSTKTRISGIKAYVKSVMDEFNVRLLMGTDCSLKLVKNGGKQSMKLTVATSEKTLRHVLNPADIERHEIPQKYLKQSVVWELDTEAIRKDLEDGITTPLGTLKPRGESVRTSL